MALLAAPGSLPTAAARQTIEWLIKRLEPGEHVEDSTTVEEYDVPYIHNEMPDTFQNSLPHFAGPVTLSALIRAGVDPLQAKIFNAIEGIIKSQESGETQRSGTWKLPRSPQRPSIWAIWPFVAALTEARAAIFPPTDSTATLLFPGCAIIQSSSSTRHLTRRLLIKNALVDWLRQRKLAVGLWTTAIATIIIPLVLWRTGQLTLSVFLIAMVLPALILIFQMLWDRKTQRATDA